MRVTKLFVLRLIGWEVGASFLDQSQSELKQNQSKIRITFDASLKTGLTCSWFMGVKSLNRSDVAIFMYLT